MTQTLKNPPCLRGGLEPVNRPKPANKNQKPKPAPRLTLGTLKARRLLALDTETTGIDLWHGCRPFFVSVMDEEGNLQSWEWDVNPLTRSVGWYEQIDKPKLLKSGTPGRADYTKALGVYEASAFPGTIFRPSIPSKDKEELTTLLQENDFVLHNTKFDTRALELSALPRLSLHTCHDTLIASHCLVSNESHKLKDLAIQYLNIGDDDQSALRDAVNEARRIARQLGWQIADGPHPHFPAAKSSKDGWWQYDMWLPHAIAKYKWEVEGDGDFAPPNHGATLNRPYPHNKTTKEALQGHPWWTVLRTYALRDVERTYPLWLMQKQALEEQGLWDIYLERRKLLESTYEMETNGVTISKKRGAALIKKLKTESAEMEAKCLKLAGHKLDNLNSPKQLTGVLFGNMGVKPVKLTGAGMDAAKRGDARKPSDYSTAADAMQTVLERLHESYPNPYLPPKKRQAAYDFVWNLLGFRAREKSLDYLEEYFSRAIPDIQKQNKDTLILHPSFNPTGSDTLRYSSSGPNAQNIGKGNKRKDDPVPSLRSVFGPGAGREWYSVDYSNIELRIFAYQSGDKSLISAYEQGYKVHCIFAKLLWEKEYKQCEKDAVTICDKKYKGEVRKSMKDDLRKEAENLFSDRYYETLYTWVKNGNFGLIYGAGEAKADATYHRPGAYRLIRQRMPMIDEFMQQKNHEAKSYGYITTLGGYRLWVPPSEPHVAVNYFVQGSAGWCMVLAINHVHEYLTTLNKTLRLDADGYQMIMTIHDELDFDFPKHERNPQVITKVARLMEQSGADIGVPTPVEVERHTTNWSEGEKVNLL